MDKTNLIKSSARMGLCVLTVAVVTACGGGAGNVEPKDPILSDAPVKATGNAPTAADPGTPEFTPSLGVNLDVAYADASLDEPSSTEYIGSQWEYMQTCLQVSAQEPVVMVIDGELEPTDSNDDVVRFIDGQIQASSHVTDTSATIQIRAQDFDGSLGKPGSFLRSIMGRYLWLANSLAERDYPRDCANVE